MSQTNRTINPVQTFLQRSFQKNVSTLNRKLLIPSIGLMVTIAVGLIIYITVSTFSRNQSETIRDLTRTNTAVQTNIDELRILALGLATEMANSPQVQAAFAEHNRELLTEITLPTFEIVQQEFGVKQFQFILPPAKSFLRLHQLDKFGDDLSSIRFTVLEANSTKKPVSGIEIGRGGLGVRGEVPVFYQGRHIGVVDVGLDIGPTYLETLKEKYGADVQIMLETNAAQAATFAGSTSEISGPTSNLLLQSSTFTQSVFSDARTYERVLNGETVLSTANSQNKTYSIISSPLKDYSGKVIGVLEISIDRTAVIASQSRSLILSIVISILATVLGSLVLARLFNRTLQPINILIETAAALTSGDLERQAVVETNDELGILASTFNTMTNRLREILSSLEQRVANRTHNLELAAEVGRRVSQVRDLDIMLKDACDLILKEFGLYYVQVYLADISGSTLKLEAGTGTVGAQLTGQGHSLPLNTGSINGRAASEKRSVVISDTAQSASFRPNALLPETRGEMAVPLIVADKVVGVLDMQSSQPGVLSEEVLPAFEALAGQLAVAIQNANLLKETEQARAQVEAQARRLVREGWSEHLDAIHKPEQLGFMFTHNQVTPLAEMDGTQLPENGKAISAPIAVTGEPLGSLVVEIDDETRREQTGELVSLVARQVAQQIENLRLLESAERYRYEAEQAVSRQTRENWQAYFQSGSNDKLSYLYDLNEVRLHNNGDETYENLYTFPLKVRDETIGKLAIQRLGSDDNESIDLINAVADRLTTHLEGLRQSNQTQSALAQSEKLFDVSRNLTQATNLQELVKTAVATLKIPEINRAILVAFDYNQSNSVEGLDVIANWWDGTGQQATAIGTHYPLEVIQVMPMFISPTPVFFDDTLTDERIDATTMQLVQRLNLRAVAVLPLHVSTGQIGALILEAEVPHHYTSEEIRLFTAIAPQIGTIMDNRRQFERAQQQADRESKLNVISQKIQSATTVEAVLQIAARELGHTLGASLTIAQLGLKDNSNGNGQNGN